MIIDLTGIATNSVNELDIDNSIVFDSNSFEGTSIRDLVDVKFIGKIVRIGDDVYHLVGNLKGVMILPDDITLEDVNYPFDIVIDENIDEENDNNLEIIQNRLDITDFLWQNILVEIPSKIKNEKNEGLTLEGNGWRLVTEDEINSGNNSPLSELSKMFSSRKE